MPQIPVELNNYPNLLRMAGKDKWAFLELMKNLFVLADHAAENGYIETCKESFARDYTSVLTDISDALFDYKGILSNHPNPNEAKSMEVLAQENNPLAIFSGKAIAYDLEGNPVTPEEFSGMEEFDLKEWFQGLLYGSRYVSFKELAQYLLMGEFALVDQLKAQNVQALLEVQPALQFQLNNGLPIGKRISGTRYFDLGNIEDTAECPACRSLKWRHYGDLMVCFECKGGTTL